MKKSLLLLSLLSASLTLSAESPVWVSSSDFSLYDDAGKQVQIDEIAAKNFQKGWIIQTKEEPISFHTPLGTIELEANSLMVVGDMSDTRPSLYLVDGQASFSTLESYEGRLTVSTTVSRYRAGGHVDMCVGTTKDEEFVKVFTGNVQAVNGLSHRAVQVKELEKLDQKRNEITKLGGDEKQDWEQSIHLVPSVPLFKGVSVLSQSIRIPEKPGEITFSLAPVAPNFSGVTITPLYFLVPETPKAITTSTTPMPVAPSFTESPAREVVQEAPVVTTPSEEVKSQEPAALETLPSETSDAKVAPVVQSKERKETHSKIGVAVSYEYNHAKEDFFQNKDSQIADNFHWLSVKPYFESKWFGLKLNLFYRTLDYQDWDTQWSSNLTYFSHGDWMESTSSLMSLIDSFHLGDPNGHIWLTIGQTGPSEEGKVLSGYHAIQPEWKNLSLGMRFGSVRINSTFDDVEMHHLIEGRRLTDWQYGTLSLSLVDDDASFFSFGAIYGVHDGKSATYQVPEDPNAKQSTIVSYPFVELDIPLLSKKKAMHFDLLQNLSTYFPLAPNMDFDNVYDSDNSSFENYLLCGGASFGTKNLDIQLTAGVHKGFINPYLRSPLVRMAGMNWLLYDSDMESRLQVTYKGKYLSFGASYTLPFDFDNDDKVACFTGTDTHADMLSIGLSTKFAGFTFQAGYEVFGLNDLASLDDEEDKRSLYKVSLGYELSPLYVECGMKRNVEGHGYHNSFGNDNPLIVYGLCEIDLGLGI